MSPWTQSSWQSQMVNSWYESDNWQETTKMTRRKRYTDKASEIQKGESGTPWPSCRLVYTGGQYSKKQERRGR